MVSLTWLPNWRAYSVRYEGRIVGMVQCMWPRPFKEAIRVS